MTFTKWEPISGESEFIGPPCPPNCPDGMFSHVWVFQWDAHDGASIRTDECPVCDRGAQVGGYPLEHLVLDDMPVRLEGHTEVFGYESPEYDHYVTMTPAYPSGGE